MQALLHSMPRTLQQAMADPHLRQRLLDTHRQVWVSFLQGHCSFSWVPVCTVSFVPSQSLFPQSCVHTFSWLYGGLMVTSSKRAYAMPSFPAPRTPAPTAVHCWPIPSGDTHTPFYLSLWDLLVLVCTRKVWALWASLVGMQFDSKCDFTPPTILLGLLCPWAWGISSQPLKHQTVTALSPRGCSPMNVTGYV